MSEGVKIIAGGVWDIYANIYKSYCVKSNKYPELISSYISWTNLSIREAAFYDFD